VVIDLGGIQAWPGRGFSPAGHEAEEWLMQYPDDASVMTCLGRSGWNSLKLRGTIPDDELLEAVDASYDHVVSRLPRSRRP